MSEKCPCSVKVSVCTGCTEKRLRPLWGSSKSSLPHQGGPQKVTEVSSSVGHDSMENVRTRGVRVKERSDFRYGVWKKDTFKKSPQNSRKPHTPLKAVKNFFTWFFCLCSCLFVCLFVFPVHISILSSRAAQNVTNNVSCKDHFHLVI